MTRPAASEPGRLGEPPVAPVTPRPQPARQTLRTLPLLAATLSTGLGAGVFADFSHTIMPGLRGTDDRTFVTAYQAIDLAIYNPWFIGGSFLGALALGILAILLSIGRPELPWIVAAVVLHVVVIVVTFAIHAPLNAVIETAGDPMPSSTPPPYARRSTRPAGRHGTCCGRRCRWSPSPCSPGR